jgi:hypothetical protein
VRIVVLQVIDLADEVSGSTNELFGSWMSLNVYLCVASIVHDDSSSGKFDYRFVFNSTLRSQRAGYIHYF